MDSLVAGHFLPPPDNDVDEVGLEFNAVADPSDLLCSDQLGVRSTALLALVRFTRQTTGSPNLPIGLRG